MLSWVLGTAIIKIGVLLLYWRIFYVDRRMRRQILMLGATITICHLISFVVLLFQCQPIYIFWDQPRASNGRCLHLDTVYISTGWPKIIEDAVVILFPMRSIWRLQVSLCQKSALIALLLLDLQKIESREGRTTESHVVTYGKQSIS